MCRSRICRDDLQKTPERRIRNSVMLDRGLRNYELAIPEYFVSPDEIPRLLMPELLSLTSK